MLEILILIFLVIRVGNKARRKGLDVLKWRVFTVIAWIVAEMIGMMIGAMILGKGDPAFFTNISMDSLARLMMIGLVSAFGGYLFIKYKMDKYPDINDDINRIGQ